MTLLEWFYRHNRHTSVYYANGTDTTTLLGLL